MYCKNFLVICWSLSAALKGEHYLTCELFKSIFFSAVNPISTQYFLCPLNTTPGVLFLRILKSIPISRWSSRVVAIFATAMPIRVPCACAAFLVLFSVHSCGGGSCGVGVGWRWGRRLMGSRAGAGEGCAPVTIRAAQPRRPSRRTALVAHLPFLGPTSNIHPDPCRLGCFWRQSMRLMSFNPSYQQY